MQKKKPNHLADSRRDSIITASQAWAVINDRKKLWQEKTKRALPFQGNEATEYGNLFEPHALASFEDDHNCILQEGDQLYVHEELPIGASPDGIYTEEKAVVECKCPFTQELYLGIPDRYQYQMQIQMFVTGFEKAYFYVWTPTEKSTEIVPYQPEFISWYIPLAKAFMEFVASDVEPPRWTKKPKWNFKLKEGNL